MYNNDKVGFAAFPPKSLLVFMEEEEKEDSRSLLTVAARKS